MTDVKPLSKPAAESNIDRLEKVYERALFRLCRKANPSAAAIAVVRQYIKDHRAAMNPSTERRTSEEVVAQMDRELALAAERRGKNGNA